MLMALSRMPSKAFNLVNPTLMHIVPSATRQLILSELQNIEAWDTTVLVPIAALTSGILASSAVHAVFDGFDRQLHLGRPWLRKRLRALTACGVLFIGLSLLVTVALPLETIVSGVDRNLGSAGFWGFFAQRGLRISIFLLTVFFMAFSLYVLGIPRRLRRDIPLWPGSLLVSILFYAASTLHVIYLRLTPGTANAARIGLSAMAVTLLSIYIFCLSLLMGLLFNQRLKYKLSP